MKRARYRLQDECEVEEKRKVFQKIDKGTIKGVDDSF